MVGSIKVETRRQGIERREVVEFYVRYDCAKNHRPAPTLDAWEWGHADAIDRELKRWELKHGILAGYLRWDLVALCLDDLRQCAVERRIFPDQSQVLYLLERAGCLSKWKPDRPNVWYEQLCRGEPLDESAALILRPAVSSELPAMWYVEDGSGRAVGLLTNVVLFQSAQPIAFAYLGRVADRASTFMREHFAELLRNEGAA